MSYDQARLALSLAIVCTDRGTHKRTRLCTVSFDDSGHWRMSMPVRSLHALPPLEDANTAYLFYCPRCPRNPQVTRDNWHAAMQRQFECNWRPGHGVSVAYLDLSAVPF